MQPQSNKYMYNKKSVKCNKCEKMLQSRGPATVNDPSRRKVVVHCTTSVKVWLIKVCNWRKFGGTKSTLLQLPLFAGARFSCRQHQQWKTQTPTHPLDCGLSDSLESAVPPRADNSCQDKSQFFSRTYYKTNQRNFQPLTFPGKQNLAYETGFLVTIMSLNILMSAQQ